MIFLDGPNPPTLSIRAGPPFISPYEGPHTKAPEGGEVSVRLMVTSSKFREKFSILLRVPDSWQTSRRCACQRMCTRYERSILCAVAQAYPNYETAWPAELGLDRQSVKREWASLQHARAQRSRINSSLAHPLHTSREAAGGLAFGGNGRWERLELARSSWEAAPGRRERRLRSRATRVSRRRGTAGAVHHVSREVSRC
jgi:hypothetical protein